MNDPDPDPNRDPDPDPDRDDMTEIIDDITETLGGDPDQPRKGQQPSMDPVDEILKTARGLGEAHRKDFEDRLAGIRRNQERPQHTDQDLKYAGRDLERATRGEIWTHAADILAQEITKSNELRATREGLKIWLAKELPDIPIDAPSQQSHPFTAFLWKLSEDLLIELVKAALSELLMPGVHLLLPPAGFVEAVLTVCAALTMTDIP